MIDEEGAKGSIQDSGKSWREGNSRPQSPSVL